MSDLVGLEAQEKVLTSCVKAGLPALCIGETGTGKTSLVRLVAEACGKKAVRVNLDGGCTPDELVGRFQLRDSHTEFELGVVPRAMQAGHVLILDEINAALPDTLFVLHALLEERPRLFVPELAAEFTPSAGFCVVATMNPSHAYAGTKELNAALYSRFAAVVRFEPLAGEALMRALSGHVPAATAELVSSVAQVLEVLDTLRREEKINTRATLREGIAALKLATDGLLAGEAVLAAILGKLEADEIEEFNKTPVGRGHFGALPAKAKLLSMGEVIAQIGEYASAQREIKRLEKQVKKFEKIAGLLAALEDKPEAPSADPAVPEPDAAASAVGEA